MYPYDEYTWDKLSSLERMSLKRLIVAIITILVLYSIYHDLSKGSLPQEITEKIAVPVSTDIPEAAYFEEMVKPGDTVLSIMEKNTGEPIPVSITTLIQDFQKLNEGKNPEEIQIGKRYKFPRYKEHE